jgi:hypothetical protein
MHIRKHNAASRRHFHSYIPKYIIYGLLSEVICDPLPDEKGAPTGRETSVVRDIT